MSTQRKIGAMLAVAGGLTLAAVPGAAVARCYAAPTKTHKAKKVKAQKVSACAATSCAASCGACAASCGACAAGCAPS
ncbi:MAG: hypothetical protein ABJN65_02130 [Parasphingorhabdus sp.]